MKFKIYFAAIICILVFAHGLHIQANEGNKRVNNEKNTWGLNDLKSAASNALSSAGKAIGGAIHSAGAIADKAVNKVKELYNGGSKDKDKNIPDPAKDGPNGEGDKGNSDKQKAAHVQKTALIKKTTKLNDYGSGATIFLDRHNINCEYGALNKFHYKKTNEKFLYEYSCLVPDKCGKECKDKIEKIDKESCKEFMTKPNILGNELGSSLNFLDRHELKCPSSFIMRSFVLERVSPKIRFRYTCCSAKVKACGTINTKETKFTDYSTKDLQGQVVSVKANEAITGFRLLFNYQKRVFHYKVDYCVVEG